MNESSSRQLVEFGFSASPSVRYLGIALLDCGPGWCEAELPLRNELLQHSGVAHAGVIATLADQCAGGAAMTKLEGGRSVVTAEFKINVLRPGRGERLHCRAQVLKIGRTLCVAESEVFAIDAGQRTLVAKLTATLAVVTTT